MGIVTILAAVALTHALVLLGAAVVLAAQIVWETCTETLAVINTWRVE